MKKLTLSLALAFAFLLPGQASGHGHMDENNRWIKTWTQKDVSVYRAIDEAAKTFGVSEGTLNKIVGDEGGNIHPAKLRRTLCDPWVYGPAGGGGLGWNNGGSSAFGPFQFMLDYKAPCFRARDWGTFGSYDDAAFREAKKVGNPVPYRFKHPASNVGQAITAAYMIDNGGFYHWCASQC